MNYSQIENRYAHHPPKGNQLERYEHIRARIRSLAHELNEFVPDSPEKERMFDALDDVMMRANAAIARNEQWVMRDQWVQITPEMMAKQRQVAEQARPSDGYRETDPVNKLEVAHVLHRRDEYMNRGDDPLVGAGVDMSRHRANRGTRLDG